MNKDIKICPCTQYFKNEYVLPAANRIIAIGDIHGDINLALNCLIIAEVIKAVYSDNFVCLNTIEDFTHICNGNTPEFFKIYANDKFSYKWCGNNTVVVQLGDQIDDCRPNVGETHCNGHDTKYDDEIVLRLFTLLHIMASYHGGAVYSLLGNHEILNISGDYRYVSNNNKKNRLDTFKPSGRNAQLLMCTRYSILIIGSFVYVHGGVTSTFIDSYKEMQRDKLLIHLHDYIKLWLSGLIHSKDIFQLLYSDESPFWNRLFGTLKPNSDYAQEVCNKNLNKVLTFFGVNGMIIAHTPQSGINNVCDKKVWRTDAAMSHAFDNLVKHDRICQVLEILDDGKSFTILS